MKENNKITLEEATIKSLYDGLDDSDYTNDVDGIVEDVLVITDPEITTDEYLELIDRAQEIVEDTPEGNIPFNDEYLGQYAQICPICGATFIEDHILEKGTACPICLDTPESFVVIGKLESDEDVADDNNVVAEDELGLGTSEVDTGNLFGGDVTDSAVGESEDESGETLDREPVNASKEITSNGNILAESRLTESSGVIKEQLNTGILPIVDVDLYSMLSSGMLDDVPDGDESKLDTIIQDVAPSFIKETIQDVLPSVEIYATGVYHPREYNYSGDELEFDLVVNEDEYNALKDKVVNDEGFANYLKSNYSSRDGFISSMPDSITEFNSADSWKQLVQVIMYALKDKNFEHIEDSYIDSFMEAVWQEFPRIEDEDELTESKFKDKVKAIKKSLMKKDKRLSDETAQKSAENIAGSMVKKEETTSKQLDTMKADLRSKEIQALKDAGDPNPENLVGIVKRLPEDVWKDLEKEENRIDCIEMIHSILTYSPRANWDVDIVMADKYLNSYKNELGEDEVRDLVEQEINEFKNNVVINRDVYTDSEDVSYNSVTFKNEAKESETIGSLLNELDSMTTVSEINSFAEMFKSDLNKKIVKDEIEAIELAYPNIYEMDEDSEEYTDIINELKSCIESDFSGEETLLNESKAEKTYDFTYIDGTQDYDKLKAELSDDELQEINDGVKAYDYYEGEDFDNASDYASVVGTRECIIQWAEGLISTLELIDDMKSLRESCAILNESNVMNKPVKVLCYGEVETYPTRTEAINFYKDAAYGSDGSEKDRYMTILMDLQYTDKYFVYDDEYEYAEYINKYFGEESKPDLEKEDLIDEYMDYVDNEYKLGDVFSFKDWLAQRK